MIIEKYQTVEELRPLGELWLQELHADTFGLDVDLDIVAQDLETWLKGEGTVLVAKNDDDDIVAMFALFAVPSYLGNQKIALEKYWYSKDGSLAGPKLYLEALNWSREHSCSHLITSGSKLASDRHDSICQFLERTGAKHFETSYTYEL